MATDYDRYAADHPHLFSKWRYPAVVFHALSGASGVYLEIGAGDGSKLWTLVSDGLMKGFSTIIAADISSIRVRAIAERIPNVQAIVADAQQLPFPEKSVDFVMSDQVIEHVPDDRRMASEICRVLKPGGTAYIGSVLKRRGAFYFYRNNGHYVLDPTHVREYDHEDKYKTLFRETGLQVIEVTIEPMRFAVGDILIRILMAARLVRRESAMAMSENLFGPVSRMSLRIPGYFMIGALLRRP